MWKYLKNLDINQKQVKVTKAAYDRHANDYAEKWEWTFKAQSRTKNDYLLSFIKDLNLKDTVLVVGCGTGRDLLILQEKGFPCLGIDSSIGMLQEALRRGVVTPIINSDIVNFYLVEGSFDAILCDSAAQHISKKRIAGLIKNFYDGLRAGGVLLIRFRVGTGKVFMTSDEAGKRYYTSYKKQEVLRLINGRFDIIEEKEVKHLDSKRPSFYSLKLKRGK